MMNELTCLNSYIRLSDTFRVNPPCPGCSLSNLYENTVHVLHASLYMLGVTLVILIETVLYTLLRMLR